MNEAIKAVIQIANTGIFGVIVGIILAVGTIRYSDKKKLLTYAYKQKAVIQDFKNKINELEITYKGNPIKDLTLTSIGIWSKGRGIIKKSEIASKEPLEIHLSGDIVGDPVISFEKTPSNQISLKKKGRKTIIIDFDFLEFEDGAVVQVFHTSKPMPKDIPDRTTIGIDKRASGVYYINPFSGQFRKQKRFSATRSVKRENSKRVSIKDLQGRPVLPQEKSMTKKTPSQATGSQKMDLDTTEGNKASLFITGKVIGSQEKIKTTKILDQNNQTRRIALACLILIIISIIISIFYFPINECYLPRLQFEYWTLPRVFWGFSAGTIMSILGFIAKRLVQVKGQRVIDNI